MTTDDPHDLAGAFALDALDGQEREAFRRHAAECPECARETAHHQEVATSLALAAADTPPPRLRERVLAEAARTPQLPPSAPGPADQRRRRRSPPRLLRLALAASLAVAAALGGVAVWQHQEARDAQQTRQEAQNTSADLGRLLAAPDTTLIRRGIYGGSGTVAVSHELNQAAYFCQHLSRLPSGKTYQLWYVTPGNEIRSVGLLQPKTSLQSLTLPPPDTAAAVAITVEPSKGSPQPTRRPVATWPLPTAPG